MEPAVNRRAEPAGRPRSAPRAPRAVAAPPAAAVEPRERGRGAAAGRGAVGARSGRTGRAPESDDALPRGILAVPHRQSCRGPPRGGGADHLPGAAERTGVNQNEGRTADGIGIEVHGGRAIVLIPAGSRTPVARAMTFTTVADGQRAVEVRVVRCSAEMASGRSGIVGRFLGRRGANGRAGSGAHRHRHLAGPRGRHPGVGRRTGRPAHARRRHSPACGRCRRGRGRGRCPTSRAGCSAELARPEFEDPAGTARREPSCSRGARVASTPGGRDGDSPRWRARSTASADRPRTRRSASDAGRRTAGRVPAAACGPRHPPMLRSLGADAAHQR